MPTAPKNELDRLEDLVQQNRFWKTWKNYEQAPGCDWLTLTIGFDAEIFYEASCPTRGFPGGKQGVKQWMAACFFSCWSSALERLEKDLNRNKWPCQWQWARTGHGVIRMYQLGREVYQLGRQLHQSKKTDIGEMIESTMRAMACTFSLHWISPRTLGGASGTRAIGGG